MANTATICMYLFAVCGAITATLDSILQRYLQSVQGEIWFSWAVSCPALLDVVAIYCFSKARWKVSSIVQISCGICFIGLGLMSVPQIHTIVAGRGLAGVIFSQFPFLCQQVAMENQQALFYAVGLSGYLAAPLIVGVKDLDWILAICTGICLSGLLISPWLREHSFDLPASTSLVRPQYIYALLLSSNLSASSTLYLISPLWVWKDRSNTEIGMMVAAVIGTQMIVSSVLSRWSWNPYQLNQYGVVYMMAMYFWWSLMVDSLTVPYLAITLILSSVPISLFMCTLIQVVHDHPLFSMSTKGMIDSSVYVIGPLINMTFLWHHSLPFVIQFFLWATMLWVCKDASNALTHSSTNVDMVQ